MSKRKKLLCHECGTDLSENTMLGAEVDGKDVDVCESCYSDIISVCQLCSEDTQPSHVSEYILVKAELGGTSTRPPGIYRILSRPFLSIPMIGSGSMHASDVLFIDRLPEFDEKYDISGHICTKCASRFVEKCADIYGRRKLKSYDETQWKCEREHTRQTILSYPDLLRDLECDQANYAPDGSHLDYANANQWLGLKRLYDLPDGLPTFHEWLFVEHHGLKVFSSYRGRDPSWFSLSPEPRFRHGAGRLFPTTFAASSLPTHEPYDSSRQYYHGNRLAREAIVKAIEMGLVRQDGTFDEHGNPKIYG